MEKLAALRESFDEDARHQPFDALPVVRDEGLILGYGTVLARMGCNRRGEFLLALGADEERLLALLSAVFGRQVSPRLMRHIWRASEQWRRGEKVLAQIELAFARFPRLETRDDAFRLFLAADLLADGMTPRRLARELGFDPNLLKSDPHYDPEEPREAPGHGLQSGRWIKLGESGEAFAPPQAAIAVRFASFLEAATPAALEGLAALAARVTIPTAILGALLIPSNRSSIEEAELPGLAGIRYRLDRGTGSIIITAPSGEETVAIGARRVPGGLLVDPNGGRALGRIFSSGDVYLDRDSVINALTDAFESDQTGERDAETDKPDVETDRPGAEPDLVPHPEEPKVCPAPVRDRPHGSRERALRYEEDVHVRVNPELPLQRGQAVAVWNPAVRGNYVYIDDCFRLHGDLDDGDMKAGDFAEAKGPGYEWIFKRSQEDRDKKMNELVAQAKRQLDGARPRGARIKWYFAEEYAANAVSEEFANRGPPFNDITIAYMRPSKRARRKPK